MFRYLSPARICLLSLLELYLSGQTAPGANFEILDYIQRQLVPNLENPSSTTRQPETFCSPDIATVGEDLQQWQSKAGGEDMFDVLLRCLWEFDGFDSFGLLFNRMNESTFPSGAIDGRLLIRFSGASPVGLFVRRCYAEFTTLKFADCQLLWHDFSAYRKPSFQRWSSKHRERSDPLTIQASSNCVPIWATCRESANISDRSMNSCLTNAEALIRFALHRLQTFGSRIPNDARALIEKWIDDEWQSNTYSLLFLIQFFESWRAGQYTVALESLHKYFDYSLAAKNTGTSMKIYYQYALLHLSILHADFECWDESLDAMNECLATARENQDSVCLNYALSWLIYLKNTSALKSAASFETILGATTSTSHEQDEIAFLKGKAKGGSDPLLLSSILLEEARLDMNNGADHVRVQENIVQAMYLNLSCNLQHLVPAAVSFRGATLERFGQTHLASRVYRIVDSAPNGHYSLTDRVRLTCRSALILAHSGQISQAVSKIQSISAEAKGVLKLKQRIAANSVLIQCIHQLRRADLGTANYYLTELRTLRFFAEPETLFEVFLLEIDFLIRQKRFREALEKVECKLADMKGGGIDPAQRLRILLTKSKIFALCGRSGGALVFAIRVASAAERRFLIPVLVEAVGVLSGILNHFNEFEAAKDLIGSALPFALECQPPSDRGKLFATLGEALVGVATLYETHSACSTGNIQSALDVIERARLCYEEVQDQSGLLDCFAMKSAVAAWNGNASLTVASRDNYIQLPAKH